MEETTPQDIITADDSSTPVVEVAHDDKSNNTASMEEAKGDDASPTPPSLSSSFQSLTDRALQFLSNASNETLGACLVGLGATTYFVFGRVGLVMMGVAGGVVLQATWDGSRNDNRDLETKRAERERRREAGIEVAKRVLEWRSQRSLTDSEEDAKVFASDPQLDYSAFEPQTSQALTTFTDYFIKDYVFYWYGWSLPGEQNFPASCRRTFTAFVLSLANHLQRKRPADAFLDFATNASSIIIVFLNELAAALAASPGAQPGEAVEKYLELKPESSLAYLLDREAQDSKLKDAAEDILQAYLDPKAYNFPTAHVFCKEVLAQLILGYTVTTCSKPEWINDWIVYLLEESHTTKEVMDIVDAGVQGRVDVPEKQITKDVDVEHRRKMDKAEEAMDEAMQEAKRLTQLMIEEDERRAREEQHRQHIRMSSSEDVSERSHTQGVTTPTSSQSDLERHETENEISAASEEHPIIVSTDDHSIRPSTPNAASQQSNPFVEAAPAQSSLLPEAWGSSDRIPSPSLSGTLTLLNATISIFDDSAPGEKASIKAKPQADYLVQIEPASSAFPGWMIARKYADFESLHEVLRRISVITGVAEFVQAHSELPKWRQNTKANLRSELERYLTDAVKLQPLAESEGMKRFLEKDQGLSKSPGGKPGGVGMAWKLGDDMISALSKAPKQVAGGSKAVLGGVAGGGMAVLGGVAGFVGAAGGPGGGIKKQGNLNRTLTGSTIDVTPKSQPNVPIPNGYTNAKPVDRHSQESVQSQTSKPSPDRHVSNPSITSMESTTRPFPSLTKSSPEVHKTDVTPSTSSAASPIVDSVDDLANLPPPPSEMPEDYGTPARQTSWAHTTTTTGSPRSRKPDSIRELEHTPPPMPPRPLPPQQKTGLKTKEPLSDSETSVTVELMFAVITELYTLSSAWNFRRTLLVAAKNILLLRPGNPQLSAIRDLLQSSLLDANLSDEGMAAHIYKLRENALPTVEELEQWKIDYPEKNEQEKEELRVKARKLLVQKGMPTALQSVMGAAASGEALGKVFDCLQVERVSRGLIFGLLLQGLRVVTH